MAWHEALISLARPDCPAAMTMRSGHLQCTGRGGIARGQADVAGWDVVDGDRMAPQAPCRTCPARLGSGLVSQVDVRPGHVRLHLHAAERQDIRRAFDALASQQPSIDRIRRAGHAGRHRGLDLDALTPRQWEALHMAAEMQYFQGCDVHSKAAHIARRMGVSKSTAHEHLQKGMAALLAAAVETHG